jgi:hypothetical protein
MTKSEWHSRTAFAEVAEALGVETGDIMATMDNMVLYTTETLTSDPPIWRASLGRDADGILVASPPELVGSTSGWHAQIEKLVEEAMNEE